MPSRQRQRYAGRIEKVVRHLQCIDWSVGPAATDLDALAAVAGMSPYHFHRVFRLMTGEPVGELVRRLRVARAMGTLGSGAGSVSEAAMASGYGTPQSFARAVREVTGSSPSELLRSGNLIAELNERLRRRAGEDPAAATAPLSIEIISVAPFAIQALRNVGDYAMLHLAFGRLFRAVFAHAAMDSLRGIYGVPLDDPRSVAAEHCRFDCGVLLNAEARIPAPVRALEIGGGVYLVARHLGDYNLVHDTIDRLVEALLESDIAGLGDAPLHLLYHDDPDERAVDALRADIFIPLANEGAHD